MQKKSAARFPKKFLWGAATSAHQVEGGNHNQWSVWELDHAKQLADKSEASFGHLDNWDSIKKQATNPTNYVSEKAASHYKLYELDFDILQKLNMNAYRFSIEWSRIEPREGVWDVAAIQHYRDCLRALKARGIEPIVTLFHFSLPVWFENMDGFERRGNIGYFVRFARMIEEELGANFKFVVTINEPEVYANESYLEGRWPPCDKNVYKTWRVISNLITAHRRVADVFHKANSRYQVSIAKHIVHFEPGDDSWLSRFSTNVARYVQNDYLVNRVIKSCDFLGINYYMSSRVYGYRIHGLNVEKNDMGWDMRPSDIQHVIERMSTKYDKPIIITENGLADSDDIKRKWWLAETLAAMGRAVAGGARLEGYMHWSLLDNFEWDKGYWPRFGLVAVDRKTAKRSVRKSALGYARFVKAQRGIH